MTENHTKMYGICENKCFVEVSPKTDTDAVKDRVDSLEDNTVKKTGNETINGEKTFTGNVIRRGQSSPTIYIDSLNAELGVKGGGYHSIIARDKNQEEIGHYSSFVHPTSYTVYSRIQAKNKVNGNVVMGQIMVDVGTDGTVSTEAPPPARDSVGRQIMTVNALNGWPSVVHTVGNEEISGAKTFTSTPAILSADPIIKVKNTSMDVTTGSNPKYGTIQILDKNGVVAGAIFEEVVNGNSTLYLRSRTLINGNKSDAEIKIFSNANGSKYATAPTTPSNANGNEIATAGWVKSIVPTTKKKYAIASLDDLIENLIVMKNGAVGTITVRAYKGTAEYIFTVTGHLYTVNINEHHFVVSGTRKDMWAPICELTLINAQNVCVLTTQGGNVNVSELTNFTGYFTYV